jgi:hypothetical protein
MAVTVRLAGISRLAGGQDGWAEEKLHAVYNFSVQWQQPQPQAFFSERYSSGLVKHKRAQAAGIVAVEGLEYPSKTWRDLRDDVERLLVRGRALTDYYTQLLQGAASDRPSQQLLQELLGFEWPLHLDGEPGRSLPEGRVALVCVNGATVLADCADGLISRIVHNSSAATTTPSALGSPSTAATPTQLTVRAERQVWETLLKAVLVRVQSPPPSNGGAAVPPAATAHQPAEAASTIGAFFRQKKAAAEAAVRPALSSVRLRHGMLCTGLPVRVEYSAVRCPGGVRVRWYRRKPVLAVTARQRRMATSSPPPPPDYIEDATSAVRRCCRRRHNQHVTD